MRIAAVCGSLRRSSSNRSLLAAAAARAPEGVDVVVFEGLRELPLFDLDLDDAGPPAPVRAWRGALADSDAVLIAAPEYLEVATESLERPPGFTCGAGYT